MKLLARNLARTTTEHQLRQLFSEYGDVTECNLVLDQETGESKGFAFVTMPDDTQAKAAMAALHLTSVAKSKIRVKVAN
ncbi:MULTISPECIES: RNA recognition motif domain-containing protein [Salinivibrio]|uniref:RNA recognition motif domain-containing protein n=1 Tax=Salinivibrio TaxID=51366 RepID=UPI00084C5B38|nr:MULTISPECIES: RNA-binding protein [Salinivibrio]ODQ00642.1 RNA recognition motif containing protein [Salinivibrio sp. DV]OOF09153.1 RNA recognition motif containing protein [Salinivibrio sp. PR5]OOF13465.1 RNA recognition motif containing protein [Salinivibrio sp. PR919]OOF18007.1 RNA recognition motif containing protein [Salinivibrio sp. PR932]OOF22019.1 RNA recognition motif containing protein [Salinivibrio sp. IB574]